MLITESQILYKQCGDDCRRVGLGTFLYGKSISFVPSSLRNVRKERIRTSDTAYEVPT